MGFLGNTCALFALFFAVGFMHTEARSTNDVLRDIPVRCITHNVTQVSCQNANITDNLVPHPDDCQLFYYCLSADLPPICRQCPSGLHFNPKKHVCDRPEQADCKSSTTNSTTTTTTTTTTEPASTVRDDMTTTESSGGWWWWG